MDIHCLKTYTLTVGHLYSRLLMLNGSFMDQQSTVLTPDKMLLCRRKLQEMAL